MNMCQNCLAWVRNTNLAVNGERFGECHLNPLAIEKYERSWCLQFVQFEKLKCTKCQNKFPPSEIADNGICYKCNEY